MIIKGSFFTNENKCTFFIPQEEIENFKMKRRKTWLYDEYSDDWYDAINDFNNSFDEYKLVFPPEHYLVDLDFAEIDG